MTKQAHITSRPGYAVGDRVLALCGKDFKVKVLWDDVPDDKPICRECVDVALEAMTEADNIIERSRSMMTTVRRAVNRVSDTLRPDDDLVLDVIAENEVEYTASQMLAAEAKAAEEKAAVTCTCTWTDAETFVESDDCPIHRPPVAPPTED